MENNPAPWIGALRHSHETLRALVEPLDEGQLEQPSYDSEWSVAQVLSHLGSQAEIFGLFLDAEPGREGSRRDARPSARSGIPGTRRPRRRRRRTACSADQATLERFESLDADQLAGLHLTAVRDGPGRHRACPDAGG